MVKINLKLNIFWFEGGVGLREGHVTAGTPLIGRLTCYFFCTSWSSLSAAEFLGSIFSRLFKSSMQDLRF